MGCFCAKHSNRISSVKINDRTVPDYSSRIPVEDRSCTDIVFLAIFSAYIIFLLVSVGMAGARGDPRRLLYGVDSYGNICGVKNSPITGVAEDKTGKDFTTMKYLVRNGSCSNGGCQVCLNTCPQDYRQTTFRRCLPVSSTINTVVSTALTWLDEVASDISLCWPHILLLCGISIGFSVVLVLVFRFCAAIIIWAVLVVVAIAAIALTIFLWVSWNSRKNEVAALESDIPGRDLQEKRVKYWLIAAIVATIFTVLYLIIFLVMRKRIALVAALFEEAGKALGAMPFILLQPIWTFIVEAIVCVFLLLGFTCLQASGEAEIQTGGEVTFPINTFFQVSRWFVLFGFLWMTQFVLACQHLVVAGAVSHWYFTRNKNKLSSPIIKSLCNTVRYHMGSAAFGSFTIAIVQLIRILFRMLEKYMGDQGQRCQILWKMLQCCMSCFENYLKFLSRNAYIMISMYGDSFCSSARKAFALLAANFMRLAALESIGDFVLFIGKVGVTVAIAFIGIEIVKNVDGLSHVWVPVGISCIFSLLISHCFLSVYEMAIDTLLLNFCDDCAHNDGVSRPYYMSRSLMVFVEGAAKKAKYRERGKGSGK